MSKENSNGWWVQSRREETRWIKDSTKSNKNKKSRHELCFCQGCSKVWDSFHMVGFRTYEDMPTYGLKRKQCKNCKEK